MNRRREVGEEDLCGPLEMAAGGREDIAGVQL